MTTSGATQVYLARHGRTPDRVTPDRCRTPVAFNRALVAQLDPSLDHIGQRTACWNQLSLVDGLWRVDTYDRTAD